MALRKCPGCKNMIAAETESCPICGCEPGKRRIRQILVLGAVVAVMAVTFQNPLRQHLRGLRGPVPANAQTTVPAH